ncbi:MAG: DUF4384 domain-containing protein [Candidatus Scalindua sp.]|jgi:hypothetical protein|nr:DUF4384 domain-containing protein [Candidatus Scalindua sp.]
MNFYTIVIKLPKQWILVASLTTFIFPGEWVIVDTSLTFSTSISIDIARAETLNLCRKTAIQRVVPTTLELYSHFFRNQVETNEYYKDETALSSFVISANSGYLLDESVQYGTPVFEINHSSFDYKMSLKAFVEPVTGERDHSLGVDVWADDVNLESETEINLHIKSKKNGFIYIFWFYADNSVALLFPNDYSNENQIKIGTTLDVPTARERSNGLSYHVKLLPGLKLSTETIYVVFSLKDIENISELISIGTNQNAGSTGEGSYTDFQKWLSKIPLSLRVETAIQISISERQSK